MKNKENHIFSSFDFFTLVASFVAIGVITTPIVLKNLESGGLEKARRDMQEISRFLLRPPASPVVGRTIASVDPATAEVKPFVVSNLGRLIPSQGTEGDISKDPWGNPYHFTFVKNGRGERVYVVVWSDGPDGQNQTPVKSQLGVASNFRENFKGDDLGLVVPIR